MNNLCRNIMLGFLLLNVVACSYSPKLLKESYKELPHVMAKDLKEPFSHLTKQQKAIIDNYTSDIFKWHRRNKLPVYAQTFAKLAMIIEQGDIQLPMLQNVISVIDDIPHIDEATHLTPAMANFSRSLNEKQITELETRLNNKVEEEGIAIRRETVSDEAFDSIETTFKLLDVSLSEKQLQLIKNNSQNLHDIRPVELAAKKSWNKRMITLLRNKELKTNDESLYNSQFIHLWNNQETLLVEGKYRWQERQNDNQIALLLKKLIESFSHEQKRSLIDNLYSISNTFTEMSG